MNEGVSKILGTGAMVLVVAAAVAVVAPRAKPPQERRLLSNSRAVWLDGKKLYAVEVLWPDGGHSVEYLTAENAPCKRRLKGMKCFLPDGGLAPELLRYPADQLSGICEGVACLVPAGIDADGPEVPAPTPASKIPPGIFLKGNK